MNTKQNERSADYAALMDEFRVRLSWLEYAVQGRTGMDGPLVREFGFLQLRMMCEVIALGCLVAHGDLPATKSSKFQAAFGADDILNGLEKLNPDYFPQPLVQRSTPTVRLHFEAREPDYLTKAQLLTLYRRTCGHELHKGSMKNLLKPRPPVQKHFPELMEPAQRLANLIQLHRIALDEGREQFICWLRYEPHGNARVIIGNA